MAETWVFHKEPSPYIVKTTHKVSFRVYKGEGGPGQKVCSNLTIELELRLIYRYLYIGIVSIHFLHVDHNGAGCHQYPVSFVGLPKLPGRALNLALFGFIESLIGVKTAGPVTAPEIEYTIEDTIEEII